MKKDFSKEELLTKIDELEKENSRLNNIALEKDRLEKSLSLGEDKYHAVFNSVSNGIIISDIDNRIIDANEFSCNLLGFRRVDICKTDLMNLLFFNDKSIIENYNKSIKNKDEFSIELTRICKAGDQMEIRIKSSVIEMGGHNVILILISDITERKKSEEELINAKIKAEESDKLKTAFLANMSHEIRTPMGSILGFSELLKNQELPENKRNQFIDIINNRGNHLLQIINDIIDISKIEANQMILVNEEFSLTRLMKSLFVDFFQENNINKNNDVEIVYDKLLDGEEVFINSDEIKIKQILYNLISNAMKYTTKGKISFGYTEKKYNTLLFYVKDTGIGISKDKQEIIFDRFRQSDDSDARKHGGTGLGLSICRGLIKLMGGEIWVDSEVNEGSTFYFTLPFSSAKNLKDGSDSYDGEDTFNWNDRKVLIVDDDELIRQFYFEIFEDTNLNMLFAEDGQEAIDIAKKNEDLDVILMDIQLPIVTGDKATAKIREFNKDVYIIAQTANVLADDKQRTLDVGCNEYLSKPIDTNLLFSKLDTYFKKS